MIQKKEVAEPEVEEEVKKPKVVAKKKPVAEPTPEPVKVAKKKPKPQPALEPEPEPAAAPEPAPQPDVLTTDTAGPPPGNTPIKMSPVGGSEIPLEKVPSGVSVVSAKEISRDGTKQLQNALSQNVPGVTLTDTAGSGFRTDVQYRGFDASPVGGRSQSLAVYQQGVRINEAFGDTVNLDAIPSNAIADMAITSNNPAFGLNAVGGALSLSMKDGFNYQGSEIDIMAGSFGRKQIGVQTGGNSGTVGAYIAAEAIEEDGFRDFSEAEVRRMYTDLGFKGSAVEVHFNFTGAESSAGVVTAAPVDLLDIGWERTFTSPQVTEFQVLMPTINAKVQATDTLTLSAVGYYRSFKQNVIDGNLSEAEECLEPADGDEKPGPGFLCVTEDDEGEQGLTDASGNFIAAPEGALGSIERINQKAKSEGLTLQAVEKSKLLDRPNQFMVGASYDHGEVAYQTSSEIGTIGPRFVVDGTGTVVTGPDDFFPRDLTTENTYYGIYFSNTLDVTDALAVTVGGRYNHATIKMADLTGNFPELNTTNVYERFNPMAGLTYKLLPGISFYGGYSEANRAPTAAELGCAEPTNPCLIESFLTDDPPLKQVVSNTWEAGFRGEHKAPDSQRLTWSLGYFRTFNKDDILNAAAEVTGRGYFLNAGDTKRQGVEAALGYENSKWSAYASYAYIDATFETDIILPAPNSPDAGLCPGADPTDDEAPTCNFVSAGDNLPGIPQHRIKAGFNYWLTSKWQVGADVVHISDQRFFGDESNERPTLDGYTRVDIHTSYDINENIQLYGFVKNVFDERYGLYGTFFDTEESGEAAVAAGYSQLEDQRSITPAPPVSAYGGLKVKF